MAEPLKLLSLAKMARELGVSKDWLRDEVEANRLPAVKAADAVLFHPPTIERLLVERASTVESAGVRGSTTDRMGGA